jgi:hypothetical protein
MVAVNKRVGLPQALAINGVDTGGIMTARIDAGFDNPMYSAPDGLTVPVKDKEIQYVRGTIVTQDWVEFVNLLTGVVGTYIFYERISGVAEATGFIKHTITAPVIHRASINFTKGGYGTVSFDFECRAADETKTIADMWALLDSQAAPAYISAARGGFRVVSAAHGGSIDIYHVTAFNFTLTLPLVKACNDSDVGYTCVDARVSGLTAGGSISFQGGEITGAILTCQELVAAAKANLVVTVKQTQGGANKAITIANVDFNSVGSPSDVNATFTEYVGTFDVANDPDVPLTLAGDNKIIAIV